MPGPYAGCLKGKDFFVGYTMQKQRGCSFTVLGEYIDAKLPASCPHTGERKLMILLVGGNEAEITPM
eukprot:6415145-Ditylum_brightwellii.AAC.1